MTASLHPIAAMLSLCQPENSMKRPNDQIRGDYKFQPDEISMLSVQLFNGLPISKIIPKDRFTVKFNFEEVKKIIDQGKSANFIPLLLLSSISWLIEAERTNNVSNFGLILNVFDSISSKISIIYQLTNYFYISIFKLNQEIDFSSIEYQLKRFFEKYKTNPNFVENTILLWLQIAYSFPTQTFFAKSILMFSAQFYKENQNLFSEDQINLLCFILNQKFSKLDITSLCFLIEVIDILPKNSIYETTTIIIDSIQTVLEGMSVTYKIFDKEKYKQVISFERPSTILASHQYPSKRPNYSNDFILPRIPFNPDYAISAHISKISNYISKILNKSSVPPNQFSSNFLMLLKNSLTSPHFFDYVATVLAILTYVDSIELNEIFSILIDSPFFDPRITIFTPGSENESVHKLRMLSYRYIVFPSVDNCQMFFKKIKFPLLVSEFFYYCSRMKIPINVLKSSLFIHNIYSSIIYYRQLDIQTSDSSEKCHDNIKDQRNEENSDQINFQNLNEKELEKENQNGEENLIDQSPKGITDKIEEEEEDLSSESNIVNSTPADSESPIIINHRKPLPDDQNNFIKWFIESRKNNCSVIDDNNIMHDDTIYFHCVLVFELVFITNTIKSNAEISKIWNDSSILPSIFSLIFDENLRPIILAILKIFWENNLSNAVFNSQSFLLSIFQQKYNEDFALLDLQLLETINKELSNFPQINRESFNLLCPTITSILINYDISSEFLHNSMKFFSFIPNEINIETRNAIIAAIKRIEGKEPNRIFFTDFILLITNEYNIKESPDYLIRIPKLVSNFIEVFMESPLLNEVIQYVDSLCQRSFANSYACHKGKVDLILLKIIGNYSSKNDILPSLSLFSKIALIASSMPVVNNFISLFCPIKSNFVPPYISELTQTLKNIIMTRQCQPIAYYPLSKASPMIKIQRFNGNQIKRGLTIAVNLFIDQFSQDYKPRILTIFDKKQVLKVGINNRKIILYGVGVPEVLFASQIPLNCWTKVAISIYPPQKIVEFHIENQKTSIQPFHLNDFQNGIINFEFGGGARSSPTFLHSIRIGSFEIYPYISEFSFKNNYTPIISVSFENKQSLLSIKKVSSSDLDATLIGPNVIVPLSFPDVLIRFFKAQILIPLFAQIDLPIYGENNKLLPPSFTASILNLLSTALQFNTDAQISFEQASGFRIIAYLLTSNSPRNLTFDLYLHFVLLYESISLPELKLQLFAYILTNAEIWALTPQKVSQQILDHWDQYLFTKYTDTFLNVLPFSKLIDSFSHFYWRTALRIPENIEYIVEHETKTIIFRILCNVAEKQFEFNDLIALLMSCVGSPNVQFCEDLLLMIRLLAQSANSPFKKLNNGNPLFLIIRLLLSCNNEKISLSVIDTLLVLHSSHIIQNNLIDLFMHVELLMLDIKKAFYNESFVEGLLKMSYSHPGALPIPFYIASICNNSSSSKIITKIINDLHPNQDFSIGKLWFLWPIVVAIKYKDFTDFIMNFIILSANGDWSSIFVTIEIIAKCLNNDPIPLQRAFLLNLGRAYISGQRQVNFSTSNPYSTANNSNSSTNPNLSSSEFPIAYNEIEEFIDICQYFIISKPIDRKSIALNVAFAISPFIEGNELDIVSYDLINSTSFSSSESSFKFFEGGEFFTNKILEISQTTSIQSKFQLDLSQKGEWNDSKLSKIVLQIITKFNLEKYMSLIIGLSPRQATVDDAIYHPNCEKLHEIFESSYDLINRFNSLIIFQANLIVENRRKAIVSNENLKNNFLNNASNDIMNYINAEDRRTTANRAESSKLWINLWRQLTLDRSPWRNSLPQSSSHFKRSQRILNYFAPLKLKRNIDFNDHKDASINRDVGSGDLSKKKFEEHLIELELKYKKEAPPPLFDLKNKFSSQNELNKSSNNNIGTPSNSKIIGKLGSQEYKGKLITLLGQKNVIFCLMKKKIQIIYNDKNKVKIIHASEIAYIFLRSFLHHERSFEIILKSGKSYLFDLDQGSSLDLLKIISKSSAFENALIQTIPFKEFIQALNIQNKWSKGFMSNFEYLMKLNFLGGRSYNELSLYPVFPWIFSDYSSSRIDLKDPSIFRDLSKPMGAITKKRLDDLLRIEKDFIGFGKAGFLYSSCYISPLTVILLLIRMEPFTTHHIQLQSGKFDHAARLFSSIASAYRMSTTHNNDYREIIPEFFYTSSFLENRNNFDLGKINSIKVNDVVLPKWSKSAIDFVYIHRKALESDYVTNHLNDWIDLIFGYKQRGQNAVDAFNTFDPSFYEDIWTKENLNDPSKKTMIEAMLQHCGHIPNQLFTQKHPSKNKLVITPLIASFETFSTGINSILFSSFYIFQNNKLRCIYLTTEGKVIVASTEIKNLEWTMIGIESKDNSSKRRKANALNKPIESQSKINSNLNQVQTRISSSNSNDNDLMLRPNTSSSFNSSSLLNNFEINLSMTSPNKFDSFCFNPKFSRFVIATDTGIVQVHDMLIGNSSESTAPIKRESSMSLSQHIGRVNCVSVSNNFIVSGGSDTIINVWKNPNKPLSSSQTASVESIDQSSLSSSLSISSLNSSQNSSSFISATEIKSPLQQLDSASSVPLLSEPKETIVKHLKSIQSFRGEITCSCINEKFGTIACGANDGSVLLIDTASLISTVVIDIAPEVPEKVMITSAWGFIVVYSTKVVDGKILNFLSIFDIDGRFIRKKEINFTITCWSSFISLDSFDYLVLANQNGTLLLCEAFYLDVEEAEIPKTASKVMSIKFLVKLGALFVARENGIIDVYSENKLNMKRFNRTVFGIDI